MKRYLIILLLFPWRIFSLNCDLIKFPRECHCQRSRQWIYESHNQTRLKCRQMNMIKINFSWSNITFDRLIFETINDNLTLSKFVFQNLKTRILRFHVENLFLQYHAFENASIEQLLIMNDETHARIHFDDDSEPFFHSTITKLDFKSIDFQNPISESTFLNSNIDTLTIHSSKFYGFLWDNSTISLKIYSIISSINTTNFTDIYLPQTFDCSHLEEIHFLNNELSHLDGFSFSSLQNFTGRLLLENNQISSLDSNAFRHLDFLTNLSLKKNFLRELPSNIFFDCRQLKILDLSFNQLTQLNNFIFDNLYQLEILILNHNPIKLIHSQAFQNLRQLKEIHFQNINILHQEYSSQWLWNLAQLNDIHLLKTDFELSDVAFCILSIYNQSLHHFSREHPCLCSIHYFNFHHKSPTDYLRLKPICSLENSYADETDLILKNLEKSCDYLIDFLDCNAMMTTTIKSNLQTRNSSQLTISKWTVVGPTLAKPLNNIRKLFTVLVTLVAITICAISFVLLWYRFKSIIRRQRKQKNFTEQQRHFNSPACHHHSIVSIDRLKLPNGPLLENIYKLQDDELLENFIEKQN